MKRESDIRSESQFVIAHLKYILLFPFYLLKMLFFKGRKDDGPFKDLVRFLLEPKATVALIAASIAMFLAQVSVMTEAQFRSLVFTPDHLAHLDLLPVVSSWFMHASLAHLAGNMLFLYIFGRIVELHFGSLRMLFIYFGSAIVSDAVSALAGQGGIGASGAIAGLISTSILISPFYLTYLIFGIPIPIVLIGWMAIIADIKGILNPADNIGHFAHIGGYLAISVLVFLFDRSERSRMKTGLAINLLFAALSLAAPFYAPKVI